MPLFSKTVTGLINGISRQPYALHLDSQGYEQINCLSDLSKGTKRRPGFEKLIHQTTDLPNLPGSSDVYHWIDFGPGAGQYLVWIRNNSTTIRIINLANGTVAIPTPGAGAASYITESSANEKLRLLTVGRTTYVVNTTVVPAMTAAVTASPANYAFVWVKAAPYVNFTLTLKQTSGGATTTGGYNNNGSTKFDSTESLADAIATDLNGNAIGATSVVALDLGNLIIVRLTDNSAFTIESRDGWGNQGMAVFLNGGKIQNFAELPARAPTDFMLEVEGDPDASNDSYFLKFTANTTTETVDSKTVGYGTWQETVKWGIAYVIDPATMPFKLTGSGASWNIDPVDWTDRVVGDTESAPDPPFIGHEIQDVAFFQNRLGMIVGESVVYSGVDDFDTFFPTTVIASTDDDTFSMTANFPEIAKLRHALPFNDLLVLFGDSGIYGNRGTDAGFSARTAEFVRLTGFTGEVSTRPVLAGDRIFFTETRDNETVLREFFQIDAEGLAQTTESVSEHVDDYISPSVKMVAADGVNNIIAVLAGTSAPPSIWIYQWFFSNREKVQSAWHRWTLNGMFDQERVDWGTVPEFVTRSCAFIDGKLYIVGYHPDYSASIYWDIMACPLSPEPDADLGDATTPIQTPTNSLIPFVDHWQLVNGVIVAADTTVTVNGRLNDLSATPLTDIIVLPYDPSIGVVGHTMGTPLTGFTISNPNAHQTVLTFAGVNWTRPVIVGVRYRSTWEARPNAIIRGGAQSGPVLAGRYLLKRMRALFENAVTVYGHWTGLPKPTNPMTNDRRLLFTQKSECEFPVHRRLDNSLVVGIHSEQPLQDFALFGVVWEGEYFPRGGRSV